MSQQNSINIEELRARVKQLGRFLDVASLKSKLAECESQMSLQEFWDKPEKAQKVMSEATRLRQKIQSFAAIGMRVEDLELLGELAKEEGTTQAEKDFERECLATLAEFDAFELQNLLSGETDHCNAILTLNAGVGGTEACDWTNMLLRMYQRWAERHKMSVSITDILSGEEAGIKSVTLLIQGENAYGNLKAERGVHRLVRMSPFNAAGKRQTSFSSCDVLAELDETIEIEVNEKDIRVDVFRSGGSGGQGVNTTDSAVRITHAPSGLVVSCQNERSQIKNRATAMKVLKSRLYELEMDKKRAEQEKHYSDKGDIGWGRQIRSYVLQPYQMVKDLRTGEADNDTQSVLDGDIDHFIGAFLRGKKRTDTDTDDE
ncbi:MAG: peptide chain release factor 2 [Blastochloris sp.]|nr:peptide chain release factor 2 [Blastochloris sp.]